MSYLCLATPGGTHGHDSLSWIVLLFWVIVWSPWTALGRVELFVIYQLIFFFFFLSVLFHDTATCWEYMVSVVWVSMGCWWNGTHRRKLTYLEQNVPPLPLCQPKIPHGVAWDWTQASLLSSQWQLPDLWHSPRNLAPYFCHSLLGRLFVAVFSYCLLYFNVREAM